MADREKVIKAIETHLSTDISVGCDDCTYDNDGWCTTRLLADILPLLKEQEPIPCGEKIKAGDVMLDFYECGYCKNAIRKPWKYCPFCGKEVKWE